MAPYAYYEDQWVGYDNAESVTLKVRYMKGHNLGGVFIWSIENDDINGICSDGKNPLSKAIQRELANPNKSKILRSLRQTSHADPVVFRSHSTSTGTRGAETRDRHSIIREAMVLVDFSKSVVLDTINPKLFLLN